MATITIGILIFAFSLIPAYYLLEIWYITIESAQFLSLNLVLVVLTLLGLEGWNNIQIEQLIHRFNPQSFIIRLKPLELVYLKTQNLAHVIHGVINEMLMIDQLAIKGQNQLASNLEKGNPKDYEAFQVLDAFEDKEKMKYAVLLKRLK